MTHDKQGRAYAKLSKLKAGDSVIVDSDFDCMDSWSQRIVYSNGKDLFLNCASGMHNLEGQLQDDNDTLIGIYHDK